MTDQPTTPAQVAVKPADLRTRLEALRTLAHQPGDPIREPRRSHIGRYHSALAKAWETGALIPAPAPAEQEPVAWPDGFYPLSGDARLRECTTDGCHQHCSIRMECGGVGSDYCEPCARKIAGQIAHPAPVPAVPEDVAMHPQERAAAQATIETQHAEIARLLRVKRDLTDYAAAVERAADKAEAANRPLRAALRDALAWIDAVPSDTQLPTMPGFDRDAVDAILDAQTEQPAPDTKGAKGKKKKLHGIEVEHTATGWAVMRKFSADYKEQLAICPNPVAAEEIAAALRPQPAPSAAPTDNTALVEALQNMMTFARSKMDDPTRADDMRIFKDAHAALASREAKPAPDAVAEIDRARREAQAKADKYDDLYRRYCELDEAYSSLKLDAKLPAPDAVGERCAICGSSHMTRGEVMMPNGRWVCSTPCQLAAEAVQKAKEARAFRELKAKEADAYREHLAKGARP